MLSARLNWLCCAVLIACGQVQARAQLFLVADRSPNNSPEPGEVALGWNPSPDTNATGYFVCWGLASGACTNFLDAGNVTNTTVAGLVATVPYYFTIVTYDAAGDQSPPSNEIAYTQPAGLTVAGIEAQNKVYDGTNNATLIVTNAVLVGVLTGDTVTLDTANAVGVFADRNVGTGKLVTVSGLTLVGADAAKYTLTQPTTNADITPASLTVTGITASDKVYDGTTSATLDAKSAALDGVISGDDVTLDLTAVAGAFTNPNAGTGKTVLVSGLTLTGTDAGNYALTQPTLTATITPANPVVTTWPSASAISYGQTLAASTLSGGSATPAGTFAFTTPSTAPNAGTAVQSVTYTPTDTVDYNTASSTVSVTVNKAAPSVATWPVASAITYGQTLAASTLSGGSATPAGTFAFTTPSTAPNAGTALQSVTYTPTDTADYNTASSTVSVTVNKASPSVTTWPVASAITYGQTLAASTLSGGSATPAGTFAFTTPSTAPNAGTAVQSVTYTPTDTADYNTVSSTVSVTVNKASPSVTTWPTASAITYGQTLAASTLSGGSATPAGTFAFTTPLTAPNAGTAVQSVTYTPTDTADYNSASSTVSVTVNKAAPSVTTWPVASAITYGQTLAASTLSGGSATPAGTFAFTTPSTAPNAGTAVQSVTYTPTDTADYNTASSTASVTVNPASSATALVSSQNPSLQGPNVTFTATATPVAPASTTPTGNVQFYTNGVAMGSSVALTDGVASLSTADLPPGTNTVLAAYLGDSNFLGSSNSLAQVVPVVPGTPSTIGIQNNADGTVTVTFTGTPDAQYVVQASDHLAPPAWENVSTNTAGTNGQWTFTDSTANQPIRFYRAMAP